MNTSPFVFLPEHLKLIGEIDEFKGRWNAVANLSPEQLSELKSVATVQSIGSSTRIEGVKLSNLEIKNLLGGLELKKLSSRDEQEVAGYAKTIQSIFSDFSTMELTEKTVKDLHRSLLQFSEKDQAHAGEYKTRPNHIEAFGKNGESLGVVFETVAPEKTANYMSEMIEQFHAECAADKLHPLLIISMLTVHFLAIHPFDDGNGRLSRILTNLLLLKAGYAYVPYCSLEKIVEDNKDRYYIALNEAQRTLFTGNENIHTWTSFFLSILHQQVQTLKENIEEKDAMSDIPPLSRDVLTIARSRGSITVGDAVKALGANRNTVKVHIQQLETRGLLTQHGEGKGTWYEPAVAKVQAREHKG